MALSCIIIAGIAYPWSGSVQAPAVFLPADHAILYAPADGQLEQLNAALGDHVQAGWILAVLNPVELAFDVENTRREIDILRWQMTVRGFDPVLLDRTTILETELRANLNRLAVMEAMLKKGLIRAPFSGTVSEMFLRSPDAYVP